MAALNPEDGSATGYGHSHDGVALPSVPCQYNDRAEGPRNPTAALPLPRTTIERHGRVYLPDGPRRASAKRPRLGTFTPVISRRNRRTRIGWGEGAGDEKVS